MDFISNLISNQSFVYQNYCLQKFFPQKLKMPSKTSPEVEHQVLGFLKLGWSYSVIRKAMSKMNVKIHDSLISRIKERNFFPKEKVNRSGKPGNRRTLSELQLSKLNKMTSKPNPQTRQSMAKELKTTVRVVNYGINKILKKKMRIKPKGHH